MQFGQGCDDVKPTNDTYALHVPTLTWRYIPTTGIINNFAWTGAVPWVNPQGDREIVVVYGHQSSWQDTSCYGGEAGRDAARLWRSFRQLTPCQLLCLTLAISGRRGAKHSDGCNMVQRLNLETGVWTVYKHIPGDGWLFAAHYGEQWEREKVAAAVSGNSVVIVMGETDLVTRNVDFVEVRHTQAVQGANHESLLSLLVGFDLTIDCLLLVTRSWT